MSFAHAPEGRNSGFWMVGDPGAWHCCLIWVRWVLVVYMYMGALLQEVCTMNYSSTVPSTALYNAFSIKKNTLLYIIAIILYTLTS